MVAVLTSEPERDLLVVRTRGADLLAPSSVHWEVGNALAAMLKRKRIERKQATRALQAYQGIPIRFLEVDLIEALELATIHDLYAYDAYVIACARNQRCSLMSLDRGLLRAAREAGVEVLEV